jgi:hypothetical protein
MGGAAVGGRDNVGAPRAVGDEDLWFGVPAGFSSGFWHCEPSFSATD